MRHLILVPLLLLLPAAPALADLELTVRLETDTVAHEGEVAIRVTFTNRGSEEVRFYEPPHAGLVIFPEIRFVSVEDGRVFTFLVSPFQSLVRRGMEGAVISLGPGEEKVYTYKKARFAVVEEETGRAGWWEPVLLPPGNYAVRAAYERKDIKVPFNVGGFRRELRPVPGLFVGRIEAPAKGLYVGPPTRPRMSITFPKKEEAALLVVFENPLPTEHVFRGAPRLELGSKMYGAARAAPALTRSGDLKDGERLEIKVPARGRREIRLDLRLLNFSWRRGAKEVVTGLSGIVPRGTVHLRLALLDGEKPLAAADGIFASIPPVPARGLEGLRVTTSLSSGRVGPGEPLELTVSVENASDAKVKVLPRLAFPRQLVIRIEDARGLRKTIGSVTTSGGGLQSLIPQGEGESKLAEGLSWDGDRFELEAGLEAALFHDLGPGESISRTIDLRELLAKGMTPGRYRIRAAYRNVESGARLGLKDGERAGTGIVWSDPVELTVE